LIPNAKKEEGKMADNCCQGKTKALEKLKGRQKRVLWIVLAINFGIAIGYFSVFFSKTGAARSRKARRLFRSIEPRFKLANGQQTRKGKVKLQ